MRQALTTILHNWSPWHLRKQVAELRHDLDRITEERDDLVSEANRHDVDVSRHHKERYVMRILIAVPSWEFVKTACIQSVYKMKTPNGVETTIEYIASYGVAPARNKAANMAVDGGYDYILFIDSDHIVPVDALEKLLSHDVDIVGGWYYGALNEQKTNIAFYHTDRMYYEPIIIDNLPQGLVKVDAMGFGCILIKTAVLRMMRYPYFQYVEYDNRAVLSEDLFFCNVARRVHGISMFCDTSLKVEHAKTIIF